MMNRRGLEMTINTIVKIAIILVVIFIIFAFVFPNIANQGSFFGELGLGGEKIDVDREVILGFSLADGKLYDFVGGEWREVRDATIKAGEKEFSVDEIDDQMRKYFFGEFPYDNNRLGLPISKDFGSQSGSFGPVFEIMGFSDDFGSQIVLGQFGGYSGSVYGADIIDAGKLIDGTDSKFVKLNGLLRYYISEEKSFVSFYIEPSTPGDNKIFSSYVESTHHYVLQAEDFVEEYVNVIFEEGNNEGIILFDRKGQLDDTYPVEKKSEYLVIRLNEKKEDLS